MKTETKRLAGHFQPATGWMNDPNGFCFFNGQYHVFFQYNPYTTQWGQMHWGHAVSSDLEQWTELPVALTPDRDYENSGGCFSGSAIEKNGHLYLFYTSVSKELGETQSFAESADGATFCKSPLNPVIRHNPLGSQNNFRDPKIFVYNSMYYLICGAGTGAPDFGCVLFFTSTNLTEWSYGGILFDPIRYKKHPWGIDFGECIECPDLFVLTDYATGKTVWVLLFSSMKPVPYRTVFLTGTFDGKSFEPDSMQFPERGLDFYAPQTCLGRNGERVLIAWMYHWGKELPQGYSAAGALSVARIITCEHGIIHMMPVCRETKPADFHVAISPTIDADSIIITDSAGKKTVYECDQKIRSLQIIRDCGTVEVFANGGSICCTQWIV